MRRVFFSLLGINVLLFVWGVWGLFFGSEDSREGQRQTRRPSPFANLPELQLLGEDASQQQRSRSLAASRTAQAIADLEASAQAARESSAADSPASGKNSDTADEANRLDSPPPALNAASKASTANLSDVTGADVELSQESDNALAERVVEEPPPLESFEVDAETLCEMVGAFKETSAAEAFIKTMADIGVTSSIRVLELPAGPGYWVYLQPETNRRTALRRLAELQARGIDSYVIPKGDLANGISLGMFSQENLAKARLKDMTAIGLAPKLEVIERTYRETWVMLQAGEERKMSKRAWSRVMKDRNNLERRQNFCLDVASQDNIQ